MMKTLIVAGATLAFVTVAGAADLPHPQPVFKAEPAPIVGKMPIGKGPIGKGPRQGAGRNAGLLIRDGTR